MYFQSAANDILLDLHLSRRENYYFGAKLVRGAYMEQVKMIGEIRCRTVTLLFETQESYPLDHFFQERQRAKTLDYEDPINPTFEATSAMYERGFRSIIAESLVRERGKVSGSNLTGLERSFMTSFLSSLRYAQRRFNSEGC